MLSIGYFAAFAGGVLALLSPCSALLLPSFFAYAFSGRTELVARTGVFFLGLALVLVPLGAGSAALASVITGHRELLISLAGWLIIALGVVQILGGGWSLAPAARFQQRMASRGTWISTVGLGAAYGLAGFCSGPILGAVLTVAAAGGAPRGRGAPRGLRAGHDRATVRARRRLATTRPRPAPLAPRARLPTRPAAATHHLDGVRAAVHRRRRRLPALRRHRLTARRRPPDRPRRREHRHPHRRPHP